MVMLYVALLHVLINLGLASVLEMIRAASAAKAFKDVMLQS